MKKSLLFAVSIMMIAANSFASAGNEVVDKKIAEAFTKTFAGATAVKWNTTNQYTKAEFVLDGIYRSAFFAPDANLMGLSRNLTTQELPLELSDELKSAYKNYWVTELFEYVTAEEGSYYITLENADKIIVLKSDFNGFSVHKKTVK